MITFFQNSSFSYYLSKVLTGIRREVAAWSRATICGMRCTGGVHNSMIQVLCSKCSEIISLLEAISSDEVSSLERQQAIFLFLYLFSSFSASSFFMLGQMFLITITRHFLVYKVFNLCPEDFRNSYNTGFKAVIFGFAP